MQVLIKYHAMSVVESVVISAGESPPGKGGVHKDRLDETT
jgi:hypothetical protein